MYTPLREGHRAALRTGTLAARIAALALLTRPHNKVLGQQGSQLLGSTNGHERSVAINKKGYSQVCYGTHDIREHAATPAYSGLCENLPAEKECTGLGCSCRAAAGLSLHHAGYSLLNLLVVSEEREAVLLQLVLHLGGAAGFRQPFQNN
jgi:hypothetical protein